MITIQGHEDQEDGIFMSFRLYTSMVKTIKAGMIPDDPI